MVIIESATQQHAALTKGNNMPILPGQLINEIITPDQKPKQRLHLNNSSNKLSLHSIFLGQFKMDPYFNM